MNTHFLTELKQIFKDNNQVIIVMTGLPGSGKSTLIKQIKTLNSNIHIASTDDLIENRGSLLGLTYSQVFKQLDFKEINKEFQDKLKQAYQYGKHIIIDQTNMSSKSRKGKLSNLHNGYKVSIDVICSDEQLFLRLSNRAKETGKFIPHKVVEDMRNNYEKPSKSEGFNKLFRIET